MGYRTVESVMKYSRSKGSARLLLFVLATHADDDSLECFPGRDLLCEETAMSERNVTRALKQLEEDKELTINRGNGRGNQTHYKLSIDSVKGDNLSPFNAERVTKPVIKKGDKSSKKGAKLSSIQPIKGDKSVNKGCQIRQERVTNLVIKGDKSGFAYKEEPSLTIMEPSWNHEEPGATAPDLSAQVLEVFTYWQNRLNHQQAKLTPERKQKIEARLKQKYTVEQLKQAIDGCASSPFHMGQAPGSDGTVYDNLALICRDGEHVEMFIGKLNQARSSNGRTQIPHRETHNERAFRETFELAATAFEAPGGFDSPDTADTAAAWPPGDVGGF